MKLTTTALALALAVSATPAAAQYDRPPPPPPPQIPQNLPSQSRDNPAQAQPADDGKVHPSAKALKAIVELQKAVIANDTANIPAKVAAAQAVATTKDDRYIIAQFQLKAAYASNDDAALATAIDAVAASGFIDKPSTMADLYVALGSKLYNAKKFDGAASAFEHATTLNPSNTQALINLAESRFSQGRKPDAVSLFQRAIQAKIAAGEKPEEGLYKRALGIAYDLQMPVAMEIGKQWITAYPSPASWRNALALYQNFSKPDVEAVLDALRLMRATNSLSNSADYSLYATAAAQQMNYNEAQVVIDQGLANKQIDPSSPLFRDIISGLKTKPKATEADLVQAVKDAKDGKAFVRIGDRYYAMGNYAKAAELYRQAIGKAGVDSSVANMHLGMALAQTGDKAGATAAFNAVSGSLAEVAKYWLIYVQQRA
jgi:tetratricopeptide (TPR) repeat protein